MNKVRFKIDRLGAMHDSELELKPLMIFSGESGLGKSYAAFLVHYLYVLLRTHRMAAFFVEKGIDFGKLVKETPSGSTLLEIQSKELFDWINRDAVAYIAYLIGNEKLTGQVHIEIPYPNDTFTFTYLNEIGGMDDQEEIFYRIRLDDLNYRLLSPDGSNDYSSDPTPLVTLTCASLTKCIFGSIKGSKVPILMPPSRGALMELAERPAFRSGMYYEFFDFKSSLNTPLKKQVAINAELSECLARINDGSVQEVDGRLMYYTADGAEMPLTAAASSVKEMAPFTLFLNKFPAAESSVLLEEPEAHLHPKRQIKVADLVACAVNMGCNMQITTHSDYFIKRLNTLIKLYDARSDEQNRDNISELMAKWGIKDSYLIDPDMVGAYLLRADKNGSHIESQNIADENGIPFSSFYETIENDLQLTADLNGATS